MVDSCSKTLRCFGTELPTMMSEMGMTDYYQHAAAWSGQAVFGQWRLFGEVAIDPF